ncbi:MAG TPA: helix-turn-helix domain-containing protein [Clostridia bacterium]|nr:helix-turn-helix domain-containing protein [Clostridia bacterium]
MGKGNKIYTCPIDLTIDVIGGKWSMWIIWSLLEKELRFGELKRCIPNITEKMLIQQLRLLESFQVISRKVYTQVPPKVEYSLTDRGKKLKPILMSIREWGIEHLHQISANE